MAETAVKTKDAPKESLFSAKNRKLITDPLSDNNPITVQVLGICSALAVTTLLEKALVMAIAVVFVCIFSNIITSALRNAIPKQVRLIVQLVIIATLVTVVEISLKALNYGLYKELSVFIGLIITNCIIMGRLEAFAMGNNVSKSFLDGLGNGIGYGVILLIVAFFREFFGKGSLFGWKVLGPGTDYAINTLSTPLLSWYAPNNLMVLFPSAMIVIGVLIWIHRSWNRELIDIS